MPLIIQHRYVWSPYHTSRIGKPNDNSDQKLFCICAGFVTVCLVLMAYGENYDMIKNKMIPRLAEINEIETSNTTPSSLLIANPHNSNQNEIKSHGCGNESSIVRKLFSYREEARSRL
ncbi:unnamed protein product [Caenorhabditis brenneri]